MHKGEENDVYADEKVVELFGPREEKIKKRRGFLYPIATKYRQL